MLQLIVVGVVALGIFLYLRSTKLAKDNWLKKLDLPGLWHWQDGKATLTLTGGLDRGRFVAREQHTDGGEGQDLPGSNEDRSRVVEGEWQLNGHRLELRAPGYHQVLDLTLYQPGSIGLEDETGSRRAYTKESTNVVPLKK